MPVEIHQTPNPNARKYVLPGTRLSAPVNFSSTEAAAEHPVAMQLFRLPGVYNVFMAQDFVTVNKRPAVAWSDLEPQIIAALTDSLHGDTSHSAF